MPDPLETGLLERAVLNTRRPADQDERAAFGRSDDVREFGFLMLQCFVLGNAPPRAPIDQLALRRLCDATFAGEDADGMRTDGVDVEGLRGYLDAEDGLRVSGVGGVDMLDAKDGSGWELIHQLMHPEWNERLTAEAALRHPFWAAPLFF